MAKNMTTLTITIDSEQAKKMLDELKERIDLTTESLKVVQEKLRGERNWDVGDTAEKLSKESKSMEKSLKSMQSSYDVGIAKLAGVDEQLKVLNQLNYNELTKLRSTLTNRLKNAKKDTEDEIKAYEEAAQRLQKVRDEIAKRDIDVRGTMTTGKAAEVMASPKDYSTTEINQAIEATRKLRDMQQTGSTEWHNYNTQIEAAKKFLDDFNASVRQTSMEKQFVQLPTISDQALKDQKSYWQAMVSGAQQGSKELAEYEAKLKAVSAEEEERLSRKAGKVMGNLQDYSVEEIEEAIKLTEKLQKAQQPGSAEWQIYGEEIKRAKEYLQGYIDLDKQIDMEDKWSRLPQLSANALAEQKKYWQEMVNGAANGSKELAEYEAKLKEVVEEEQMRLDNRYTKVMQNPESYSVKEVQDAVKAYEQLRDAQRTGSGNWEYYNQVIERTRATLKKYNDEAKATAMSTKLSSISTASTASLAEQKKYWQEMVAGAEKGSAALTEYEAKLKLVTDEERTRIQQQGKQTVTDINAGNWDKTIGETKEAIKQLQEYRNTLNATNDATALQDLDKALDTLTQKTKEAEQGFVSWQDALHEANNLDNFKGTIEQLEKMKKALQEARKNKIDIGDTDNLKQIDEALGNIDAKLDAVNNGTLDLKKILSSDLRKTSLKDLERAAAQLEKELADCSEEMEEFTNKSAQLRRLQNQIESMNKSMKAHAGVIASTAKRLLSYVLVYAGFNEVVGWVKQVINANLQLSDSLADIQKTTGLTAKEINSLSDSIRGLDTRTTTEELHQLAATAGQIGLTSSKDIFEFVKAANMINVALSELGKEGVASLMKVADATGEVKKLGVEKALLSVGSSINELSANSAASAPAIVDMVKRLGSISVNARMSSADLAAIGATTDALAQSTEVAGTAMSMFIGTLVSKTPQVAKAVGLETEYLQGLIDQGKTTEAMIAVFEQMNKMGGLKNLVPIMGDLGSEGQRMTNVLSLMSTKVEFLKKQVELSRTAFADATSVINEYNIKNEDAAAILERMKNAVVDFFTGADVVNFLKDILVYLYELPAAIERNATVLTTAIAAVLVQIRLVKAELMGFGGGVIKKIIASLAVDFANLTKVVGALFRTLSAHPFLTVASVLGVLAAKAYDVYRNNNLVGNSLSRLSKLARDYEKESTQELTTSRLLFDQLKNSEKGTTEYYSAKKKILDNYGKFLEGMGKEVESLENIKAAQDAVTLAINNTVRARIAERGSAEAQTAYANTAGEAYKDMFDAIKNSGKYTEEQAQIIVDRYRTILEQGKELPEDLKEMVEDMKSYIPAGTSITGAVQMVETNPLQLAIDQIRAAKKVLDSELKSIKAKYGDLDSILPKIETEDGNGTGGGGGMTDDEYKAWQREQKRQAREQQQAAMSALEAYYNERETLIRKKGLEEGKTKVQIDQQLESLQTEKLKDEIELRKMLLDEFWQESTFDPKKFKGVLSGLDYFGDKDLNKLREQLKLWGIAMEDGLKRQLTEREVRLAEQALKLREKINKILLEDNFTEQVAQQYLDSLQELGLLFGLTESEMTKTSEKEGRLRLAYMKEWSGQAYTLNAAGLQKLVEQNEMFSAWRIGRDAKDYEALLIQLRKFHDDQEEADRKAAERRKKIFDNSQQGMALQNEAKTAEDKAKAKVGEEENDVKMWDRFRDLDLVTEDTTDEQKIEVSQAQIALYQAKIDASQKYIEQMQLEMQVEKRKAMDAIMYAEQELARKKAFGVDTTQAEAAVLAAKQNYESLKRQEALMTQAEEDKISEARAGQVEEYQNIADSYVSIEQRKVQEMKKYSDAIIEFTGAMTEADWDDVESRKEAAKTLVKSLLTTLKDWATVKLTELAMKQMFANQSNAIAGQEMIGEMSGKIAETSANVTMNSTKATANAVGKYGLKGLLIGAAISAALTALMNVAMKAFFKSKSEVAAATGASSGRLATGMLTYAEGNYPVLGNDGQVYNAKYEGANIKTGIYGGGAHFGIFSEKKPEAIIDGDTTQRLILNHPDIWQSIVTLSKYGRLNTGMRTFATGNINELARTVETAEADTATDSSAQMMQMQATLDRNSQIMAQLTQVLAGGIKASINMYGDDGLYKQSKKAEKFANRRGYK